MKHSLENGIQENSIAYFFNCTTLYLTKITKGDLKKGCIFLFLKHNELRISKKSSSSLSCYAASTDIPDLSRHFSLSFIVSGRSSELHPVSSHSCCMYVRAGRPAFAWPYAEAHRSTSFMSSSQLPQQCPACLVRLAWIVFVMGGRWPYSWCLVGCCRQDLFNIAPNIIV